MAFPPVAAPRKKLDSIAGLSFGGVWLFMIGILVIASGYEALRPKIAGLALHASLIPIGMAFPVVALSRMGQIPTRVMVALLVFCGLYAGSVVNGTSIALNEVVKIGSTFVTIVTCALLVRKRGDFVAGVLGLSLAIALLAIPGLRAESRVSGIDVLEGTNKNTYSMFALPAVLLAGFIYLRMPAVPKLIRWLLIACGVMGLLIIFMSANRSGYVGAALVGLMLFWNKRGKGLILVVLMGGIVAGYLAYSGSTRALDRRLGQTVEGNASDESRVRLVLISARVCLENPIIGVSPQGLPLILARYSGKQTGQYRGAYAAHNVFAHVAGGSGIFCFAALMLLGWALWNPTPKDPRFPESKDDPVRIVRGLLRMMVVFWFVRGQFTSEIHFNPSCNIALGLMLGLYILALKARDLPDGQAFLAPLPAQKSLAPRPA